MALQGGLDALSKDLLDIDRGAQLIAGTLSHFASLQHLLDRRQQAIAVGQHDPVELLPLRLGDGPPLECFEVEADRGDRGLQFVGDGVEKAVLPFVTAHFADEKDGIEDDAGDEQREKGNSQHQRDKAAPVEDDPPELKRHRNGDHADAEGDEQGNRASAAGDMHKVACAALKYSRGPLGSGSRKYNRKRGYLRENARVDQ